MPKGIYIHKHAFWKGKKLSKKHRENLSNAHKGIFPSKKTKQKMRENKIGEKNKNWKGGKPNCVICEKKLTSYKSKRCNNCKGEAISKEKNYAWVVDRTKLSRVSKQGERRTSIYADWRRNVWLRDNFKCKINNSDCCGRIEAHHILSWRDYVELRYLVNNGITLCHFHHPRKIEDENKLSQYFQKLVAEMK